MTDKKVSEIYDDPDYEQILRQYWNNGTAQIQDPRPIVDSIRKSQIGSTDGSLTNEQ